MSESRTKANVLALQGKKLLLDIFTKERFLSLLMEKKEASQQAYIENNNNLSRSLEGI